MRWFILAIALLACGPVASGDEKSLFPDGRFSPRPASIQPVLDGYADFRLANPGGVGDWTNQMTALLALASSRKVDQSSVQYCMELVTWAMAVQLTSRDQDLVPVEALRRQGIPETLTAQQYRDLRVLCETWEGGEQ